jgi:hypothetical protein
MGSTAQNEKAVWFQNTPHVVECLCPVRVVLEALARNNCIKVIVRTAVVLTPNDEVHPWTRSNINAKVVAVAEVLAHRAIYIQGANLEHLGVVKVGAELLLDELDEPDLL